MNELNYSTNVSELLSSDHAVVYPFVKNISNVEYLKVIGSVIGASNIHSIYRNDNFVKVYLKSKDLVSEVIKSGIKVQGFKPLVSLNRTCCSVVLSRVDPTIPSDFIENLLQYYGTLKSPLKRLKLTNNGDFSHVISSDIRVTMEIFPGILLPPCLKFTHDGISYQIKTIVRDLSFQSDLKKYKTVITSPKYANPRGRSNFVKRTTRSVYDFHSEDEEPSFEETFIHKKNYKSTNFHSPKTKSVSSCVPPNVKQKDIFSVVTNNINVVENNQVLSTDKNDFFCKSPSKLSNNQIYVENDNQVLFNADAILKENLASDTLLNMCPTNISPFSIDSIVNFAIDTNIEFSFCEDVSSPVFQVDKSNELLQNQKVRQSLSSSVPDSEDVVFDADLNLIQTSPTLNKTKSYTVELMKSKGSLNQASKSLFKSQDRSSKRKHNDSCELLSDSVENPIKKLCFKKNSLSLTPDVELSFKVIEVVPNLSSKDDISNKDQHLKLQQKSDMISETSTKSNLSTSSFSGLRNGLQNVKTNCRDFCILTNNSKALKVNKKKSCSKNVAISNKDILKIGLVSDETIKPKSLEQNRNCISSVNGDPVHYVSYTASLESDNDNIECQESNLENLATNRTKRSISKSARFFSKKAQNSNNSNKFMINCNAETLNENSIRKVSCDKDLNGKIFQKVLPGKDQSEISQSFVETINKNTDVKTRKGKRYWYNSAKTKNSKITSSVNLVPNVEHKSEALTKSTQNVVPSKPLNSSPNTNSNVGVTLEDNSLIEILKDNQLEKNLSITKEKVEVTKMRKMKRKRKWNKSSSLKQYKKNATVKPSKNCKPELNLNIDINPQNVFENTNCSSNCTQLNSSEKIESLIIKTNENFNNESESLKNDLTSVIFISRESSRDGNPPISNLDNSSQENEETLNICELSCQTEAILSEKTDSNMKAIASQEVEITSLVSSKRNDKELENNTEILNHEEDITSNKENFKVSYDEHSDCTLKKTKFDEIGDQEMLVQIDVSDSIGSTIDNCINMQTPDVEEFNLSNLGKNCEKILAKYKMSPNLSNSIDSNNLDNSNLIVCIKESVSTVANNINKGQRLEQPMNEKDSKCSSLMVNCEEIPKSCKIFKSPSKNSNSKKLNDLNITISSDDGCEEFDFSLPENTINEIESYLLVDLPNNVQQFDENIDTDATKNEILNTKILKNKENDVINASKSNDKALSETALPPNDVSFNAERLDTSENVASCVDSNVCDKNNFPNLTISNGVLGEHDIDCYVMVHSPSTFLNANTSPRNLITGANNTTMNGEVVGISSSTINEKVTSNSGLSKSANSSNTAVEDVLETIVSSVTPNDSPNDLIRNSVPSLIISDVSNKALDKVENRVDCFVKVHELSPLLSADSTTEDMTDKGSIKSSAESVLLNSVNILDDQHASCEVNSSDSTTQPDIAEKIDFSITSSDSPCDLNENSVPSSLISDTISNNVDCHVMVHDPLVSSSADTTIMNDGDNITIISKESGLNFPIDSDKQASNTKLSSSDDHLKATRFDVLGKVTSPFSLDEGPSITISDTITNSEMDPDVDCYVTVQDILPSLREVSSDINLNSLENVSGEANLNELQIKISSLSSLSTSQPESNFETISCNSTPFENMTGQFVAMEETAIIKQEYIEPDEQVPNPLLNPVTLKEDRPSPSKSMTINLDSEHNKKKVAALHAYIEQIKMRKKLQSKKLTKKAKAICSVNNNNLTPSPYDFDETQEETTSLKSLRVNKFKKTNLQSPVKKKPKLPCVVLFKDKNNFRGKWKVKMKMRDQDEVPVHNLVSSTSQTVTKKNFSNKKVSKSLSLERKLLKIKAKNSTNKPASSSSILNNSNKFKIIDSVNIISEHIEAEPQNSVSESYMNFNSECVSKVIENDISSSSESHSDTFSPDSVSCESNISTVINSSLLNENESASCSSQIFETYVAKVEEVKPVYEDIYSAYNQVCDVSDSDDEKTVPNFPLRREKLVNFMNEVKRHRNPRTYALKVLSNNKTPGSLTALIVQLYEYFKACKSRTKRLRISRLIRALDDRYSRC
ncbi:fap1 adhesin-like [Parasteatoda tepidariorum]|uniref:fap1 adhesin-like n=1 Tax=Parasteatoda tepidariorum TaxID=114398 RepID=UPI0039BC714B